MSRRSIAFSLLALVAAAVFLRLGVWQLARLHEKVRRNASIAAQQLQPAARLASVPRDTAGAHYRKVTVSGRFDYDQEVVLGARTHQGSPGADLVTPLVLAGSDTAILVNRGWVYSPDGVTVDRQRWRERDTATITGYVEVYAPDAGVTKVTREPRMVRQLSREELHSRVKSPLAPYYLVATGDSADGPHPARLELPPLDEGPHRSYAMQWFAFAALALAGAGLVIARERRLG
jgi:surfeit locus 1 family protein